MIKIRHFYSRKEIVDYNNEGLTRFVAKALYKKLKMRAEVRRNVQEPHK